MYAARRTASGTKMGTRRDKGGKEMTWMGKKGQEGGKWCEEEL